MKLFDLENALKNIGPAPPRKLFMSKKLFRDFVDEAVNKPFSLAKSQTETTFFPQDCVATISGIEVYTSEYLPYGMIFDQDMKRIA